MAIVPGALRTHLRFFRRPRPSQSSKTMSSPVKKVVSRVAFPKNAYELKGLVEGIIETLAKALLYKARCRPFSKEKDYYFWTSWSALAVYLCFYIAMAVKRWWVLYGVLVVGLVQILWVAFLWAVYVIDDPKLWEMIQFCRGWLRIIVKESETILAGKSAAKFLMAASVIANKDMGINYIYAAIRYKSHIVNQQLLEEIGENILSRKLNDIRQSRHDVTERLTIKKRAKAMEPILEATS